MIYKTILCLLLFTLPLSIFTQNTFEIIYSTLRDEGVIQIVEIDNGDFLAVGFEGDFSQPDQLKGLILFVSNVGDTSVYRYTLGDTSLFFTQIAVLENNHYLLFGSAYIPADQSQQLLTMELDSKLSIVDFNLIQKDGYRAFYQHNILPANCGYYLVCNAIHVLGESHILLAKIKTDGDTLCTKIISDLGGGCSISLIEYSSDSSSLWLLGRGCSSAIGERIIFDTNFNFKYNHLLPNQAKNYFDLKWVSDTSLLFVSDYTHDGTPQDDDIGISEVDSSFTQDDIVFIGSEDTMDYPAAYCAFDFTNADTIFFAGTNNVIPAFFPQVKNHIMIGCLNRNLEQKSMLLYGGDAYYFATNIICTSDGGCLISSRRYDYEVQDNEYDVLFLKLSKHDIITVSDNQIDPGPRKMDVFSNLGNGWIYINSNIHDGQFLLFNSIGVLHKNIKISFGLNFIQTKNLSNGLYSYVILKDSKTIDSGKWIKTSN